MRKLAADYFDLPRPERLGAATMLVLSILFLAAPSFLRPFLMPKLAPADPVFAASFAAFRTAEIEKAEAQKAAAEPFSFDPNDANFDDFVALGLPEWLANRILNYREKGGQFRRPDDFSKIYGLEKADFERLKPFIFIAAEGEKWTKNESEKGKQKAPPELFLFDPNRASKADFQKLGLSDRTAQSILNYREKGGVFRKKADFSKIFMLSPADFTHLEPFIDLPESAEMAWPVPKNDGPTSAFSSPKWGEKKPPLAPIDANSASLEEWKSLPGIGDFFAQKIVRFRDALGGFSSLEQVAETRNLPDSVFQKARPFLRIGSPVFRKIRLNSAAADELSKHPFLDRRAAEAIVAFRQQHGPFEKAADLQKIRALPADLFKKLEPYLGFD